MFPIQTHITWSLVEPGALTNEQKAEILNMATLMESQGKTDDALTTHDNSVENEVTTTRFWIDLAAAEEWTNYLQPFNPLRSVIES